MTEFSDIINKGAAHAWLYIPTAVALGALHGLEPGHSKTMMAAFIVAVRGTVKQAVLLGLSAAISHSLVIWILAATALQLGSHWNAETAEPYFQIASGIVVAGLALWMFWRTRRDVKAAAHHHHHHDHGHSDTQTIKTGSGNIVLSVFEEGVPPVFRLSFPEGALPESTELRLQTVREDGTQQHFGLVSKGDFLESTTSIPEPHNFDAVLEISYGPQSHTFIVPFREEDHHGHSHAELTEGEEFADAHERAHAEEIQQRFAQREVTTAQIILFGLSGGLLPCPAAFSILIVCLQLKRVSLGFAIVAAFSIGLALTLVATGTLAAWSVKHATKRFKGFGEIARRAPYFSSAFLVLLACYMVYHGWTGIR